MSNDAQTTMKYYQTFTGSRQRFLLGFLNKFDDTKARGEQEAAVDAIFENYLFIWPWWVPINEDLDPAKLYDEKALAPDVVSRRDVTKQKIRQGIEMLLEFLFARENICKSIHYFEKAFDADFCVVNHGGMAPAALDEVAPPVGCAPPNREEQLERFWKLCTE